MAAQAQAMIFRNNTINIVSGDQYYRVPAESERDDRSGLRAPTSLAFNDAPLDFLSVYFTGRGRELDSIGRILEVVHDNNVPARCVVYGMHGVGKTQLSLQFAKMSSIQQRYSMIFWIPATTIEKLNHGFTKVLNLVGHPDRSHPEQSARLTAARRWFEDSDSVAWLLVLDNVDGTSLTFIREHLPRTNRRGNILFTTRTDTVAAALACSAGQQHEIIELRLPDVQDAVNLLLSESNTDAVDRTSWTIRKAEEVVKCVGRLPFVVSHIATFMKHSQRDLDDILQLFYSKHKNQVCSDGAAILYLLISMCFADVQLGK
jgi:hypothetical protein